MGWIIFLAVVLLLFVFYAVCPVGLKVIYDASGLRIAAFAGLIKFRLYPEFDGDSLISLFTDKKKPGTPQKDQKKQEKATTVGGKYEVFLSYARFVADILSDFKRKLVIKQLEFKLTLSADDPSDLALRYGAAWAAASNLTSLLEQTFAVKKRNVTVDHDFLGDRLRLLAKLHISITLGRLSLLGVKHLIRYFKKFKNSSNNKKDGAKQ